MGSFVVSSAVVVGVLVGWGGILPQCLQGLSLKNCESPVPPSAPAHQCPLGTEVSSCFED